VTVATDTRLRLIASGLDHPEGVAVGRDGCLYAGGEAGQVYRIGLGGAVEQFAETGGSILGLCLDADNNVYACDVGRQQVLRISPAGRVEVYCERAGGQALAIPNWPAFSSDGTLWVSDSGGPDPDIPCGSLVRIPADGGDGERVPSGPLAFANGLAVDPRGAVYYAESFSSRVSILRGGVVETIAHFPRCVPDGLALDAAGGLLVSHYQPNRIDRIDLATFSVEKVVEDWSGQQLFAPTNIAFFGEGLNQLAIACFGSDTIFALDVPWSGRPLTYPGLGNG